MYTYKFTYGHLVYGMQIKKNVIWKVNNIFIYNTCIYGACFSDYNDHKVLLFVHVLNTKYCACYSDCKDKDCFWMFFSDAPFFQRSVSVH